MRTRERTRRLVAIGIVLATAVVAAAPGTPIEFRADPAVFVLHATPVLLEGTVQLVNDSVAPIAVGSITRDASCQAEVTATVASPSFTVPAGSQVPATVHCASGVTTGMKRCLFHVNDPVGTRLIDFEGVCEYGAMPALSANDTALDFGTVAVGGSASRMTGVHNLAPATITQLYFQTTDLEGNFEIGQPCNPDARACDPTIAAVGQNGDAPFTVWCRPRRAGILTAKLHVATNASLYLAQGIDLTCNATGTTTPVLSVTGSPADAGGVEVIGAMASPVVRLRNAGDGTLEIKSVQIVDTGTIGAAMDWSYTASNACTGQIPGTCSLTAGQQVDLDLTFDPSAIGVRDASLLIAYKDTVDRSTTVPLGGIGLGATLDLVGGATTLDFGVVPINVTSTVTFQLANQGNRSTTAMLAATPSGPPFALSPATMATVAPTSPTTITATCRPVAAGMFATTFELSAPDAFMSPPIAIDATCEGTTMLVYANPTTLSLGEIRTSTQPAPRSIEVLSTGAVQQITKVELETPSTALAVSAMTPGPTPYTFTLDVTPLADGELANAVLITSSAGTLRIPVTGKIVTADYTEPPPTSLGTYCINQPTSPQTLSLVSIGTASLHLMAPVMEAASPQFDLSPLAPSLYPAMLQPGGTAVVSITPKRQMLAGTQADSVLWTTDAEQKPMARTNVSARFIEDGGAIAPSTLSFGGVVIHLDTKNAQRITIQNCDTQSIQLMPQPDVPLPFTLDSAGLPSSLAPNESATFSIGFHPTRLGHYEETLVIPSPQLATPLEVRLVGDGVNSGSDDGSGSGSNGLDERSFYGCGGCATRQPGDVILVVLAAMFGVLLLGRRRT